MEWSVADQARQDMLIADAVAAGTDMYHVDEATIDKYCSCRSSTGAGNYAYVDRSFGGALFMKLMAVLQILILMEVKIPSS